MSRVYLRKDPAFFERKAIAQDYPAGAYVALDGVLCLAESQPERGRFRDERLLRAMLGKYGRWVPFLIEKRDLVKLKDGRLYVDGWDEWQEGDWKVAERVARIRSRVKGTVAVTPRVTAPVTVDVTVPTVVPPSDSGTGRYSGTGRDGSRPPAMESVGSILPRVEPTGPDVGLEEGEARVFAFLAKSGVAIRPDSGFGIRLCQLIERRGAESVLRHAGAMARAGERLSDRQWVFGLEAALEEIPGTKEARAVDAAEERRKRDERVAATARARGLEKFRFTGQWDPHLGPEPTWQPSWGPRPGRPADAA